MKRGELLLKLLRNRRGQVGALAISVLKVREERPQRGELHWLGEVGAGVKHLFGSPALRRGTFGLALSVTVLGFIETLVFAYVDLGLHRGPAFVSVLVCVQGVGGLTGGLVAARVVKAIGEIGSTAAGVALFGLGFIGLTYPTLLLGFALLLCVTLIHWKEVRAGDEEKPSSGSEREPGRQKIISVKGGGSPSFHLDQGRLLMAAGGQVRDALRNKVL